MMGRLRLHELTTIDEPAHVVQCVEGTSQFVLFRHGLSLIDLGAGAEPKPFGRVFVETDADRAYRLAAVSDDGEFALLMGDVLELWDLSSSSRLARLEGVNVEHVQFLRGSHHALVQTVRRRDDLRAHATVLLRIDTDLGELPPWGHRSWAIGRIRGIGELPGGGRIVLAGSDFPPGVYSLRSGALVTAFPAFVRPPPSTDGRAPVDVTGVLTCADAEVCIVARGRWGEREDISVWNTRDATPIHHLAWRWPSHHDRILASLHRDGNLLGLSGDEGPRKGDTRRVVRVIDLQANEVVRTWVVGTRIKTFTMLPDGQHALTSSDHEVAIWNLEEDAPVAEITVPGVAVAWALSAQGLLLVATDESKLHAYVVEGYAAPFGIDSDRSETHV